MTPESDLAAASRARHPSQSAADGPRKGRDEATFAPLLEVRDLAVSFAVEGRERRVVAGVSYSIPTGRTLGIVGESGCGKSMTALALIGLTPSPGRVTGSVRFEGRELVGQSETEWRRLRGARVAMIFQEPMTSLNPVMTIGRQVAEAIVLHQSIGWAKAGEQAVALLGQVGIASPKARAEAYPHQLSGGMRQRAMIATALACRPALLIADEPTTALDVTIQAQILDLMQDLQAEIGMAIQFVSHNLAVVSEVSDEIIVMYAGRIVERASAEALFARPLHPYTQGLIETIPDPYRRVARLPVIKGGAPSFDMAISGCCFADRCPLADADCRVAEPPLVELAPSHFAACIKAKAA